MVGAATASRGYGAAAVLHAVSLAVTWRQLLSPWADPVSHLFIAGLPVLGAFIALFLLRHLDRGVLDRQEQNTGNR
jgi:putative oxidoreductase